MQIDLHRPQSFLVALNTLSPLPPSLGNHGLLSVTVD